MKNNFEKARVSRNIVSILVLCFSAWLFLEIFVNDFFIQINKGEVEPLSMAFAYAIALSLSCVVCGAGVSIVNFVKILVRIDAFKKREHYPLFLDYYLWSGVVLAGIVVLITIVFIIYN